MWPFSRKAKRPVYDETAIKLYERQEVALKQLGDKWCCHPKNAVRRKLHFTFFPPTVYPENATPKLRVIK